MYKNKSSGLEAILLIDEGDTSGFLDSILEYGEIYALSFRRASAD